MELNTKSVPCIGLLFEIQNRRLERKWIGDLDTVCREIGAAHSVAELWNDFDTKIVARRVPGPLKSVIGHDMISELESFIDLLNIHKSAGSDQQDQRRIEAIKSLPSEKLLAFSRFSAALGALNALEASLSVSPGLLDITDTYGMSPVAWACACGEAKVVEFAVNKSANVSAVNRFSWNLCDLANVNGHKAIVSQLISIGITPPRTVFYAKAETYGLKLKDQS